MSDASGGGNEGDDDAELQPHPSANAEVESLRRELADMLLALISAAKPGPHSHPLSLGLHLTQPMQPFSGTDPSVNVGEWLGEFKAKAAALQLPSDRWVDVALASMTGEPRAYVEARLAKQAAEADPRGEGEPWAASWDDLATAMRSGPWLQRDSMYAVRSQLDKLELQPKQAIRVVIRKLDAYCHKLDRLGSPIADSERVYVLQRAVRQQLPHWPLTADPMHAKPWGSYEALTTYNLERDAAEPERCSGSKSVQTRAGASRAGSEAMCPLSGAARLGALAPAAAALTGPASAPVRPTRPGTSSLLQSGSS